MDRAVKRIVYSECFYVSGRVTFAHLLYFIFVNILLCLKVLVVQSPSPSLQIKEPPPSPGSPSSETMYATAGGGTQIYMQVCSI